MLELIVSNAVGFIIGGGLVIIFTIPSIKRLKKAEARLAELSADKAEIETNKSTIEMLNNDVQLLMKREEERIKVQDMLCATCTYKQFFLKAEKRMNEFVNEKAALNQKQIFGPGLLPDIPVDSMHASTEAYTAD